MYKRMAEEAREEGFEELAKKFEGVAEVEAAHERRYRCNAFKPVSYTHLYLFCFYLFSLLLFS